MTEFHVLPKKMNGRFIYHIKLNGKEKRAKFEGMRAWLIQENAPDYLKRRLQQFYELTELSDYEKACLLPDKVSNCIKILIIIVQPDTWRNEVVFFYQRWLIGWPEDRKKTFKEEQQEEAEKIKDRELKDAQRTKKVSLKAQLDRLIALSHEPPCRPVKDSTFKANA